MVGPHNDGKNAGNGPLIPRPIVATPFIRANSTVLVADETRGALPNAVTPAKG